jgi:hypothetical protein
VGRRPEGPLTGDRPTCSQQQSSAPEDPAPYTSPGFAHQCVKTSPAGDSSVLAVLIARRSDQDRNRSHLMHPGSARFVVTSPCTLIRTLTSMGNRGTAQYRARRRGRERQRRQQQVHAAAWRERTPASEPTSAPSSGTARRAAATACGWCGGPITPRASGPIPKWCSATCRKRAWEQKRAAASGRSAVEIVERVVTVPIQQPPPLPRQHAWVDLLRVLSQQLDDGAVYDRHLVAITAAAQDVVKSAQRRSFRVQRDPSVGRREWPHPPG